MPNETVGGLVSAPDGTLFLSTERALYRNKITSTRWERIPLPRGWPPTGLYAPSSGDVFALMDVGLDVGCVTVVRWREASGWSEAVPLGSVARFQRGQECAYRPGDIWGRDSSDVFVVDPSGLIAHFDGQTWKLEATAEQLKDRGMSPAELGFERVSGDSTLTFAASQLKLIVREAGVWRNYEPQPDAAHQCYISSLAVSEGHPVIGGDRPRTVSPPQGLVPCMAISDGEKWNDIAQVRDLTDPILYARPQPGGIILFWNRDGQIVELVRGSPIIYRTKALKFVRGAASRGGLIYLAGDYGEAGATIIAISSAAANK